MRKARAGAFTVIADPLFLSQRRRIADLGMAKGLPSVFARNENVEAGGLMSYGPTLADLFRHARVAVLWDAFSADQWKVVQTTPPSLGVQVRSVELRNPPYDFERAFEIA